MTGLCEDCRKNRKDVLIRQGNLWLCDACENVRKKNAAETKLQKCCENETDVNIRNGKKKMSNKSATPNIAPTCKSDDMNERDDGLAKYVASLTNKTKEPTSSAATPLELPSHTNDQEANCNSKKCIQITSSTRRYICY